MKGKRFFGYALFVLAAASIVAFGTYAKHQNGVGSTHYIKQHGFDAPVIIGLAIVCAYKIYAWFLKADRYRK